MVMSARPSVPVLAAFVAGLGLVAGASIRITSPDSSSSYHAGDAVPVQWFYTGEGQNFAILLQKGGEQVADLCAAEENGVCFDLTQDQTVLLPASGLESGSDYTMHVSDTSSDAEHVSEAFTIVSNTDTNIEVTSPDGFTSLNAGADLLVSWLYVGDNTKFDIYLRQDGDRVSENLCASQADGSCVSSNPGSAEITLPADVADGADYRLLVVDKVDDDAWGLSSLLPIGVAVASAGGSTSGMSTESKLGLVIGLCAGGVCLMALLLVFCRVRNKELRREEKLATLDMLNKRRPAPSVSLAVEDMAQPDSPELVEQGRGGGLCVRLGSCFSRGSSRAEPMQVTDDGEVDSDAITPNDRPSSPDENV